MRLKDLRAIAHLSLHRDNPWTTFAAWENWEGCDLNGLEVMERVDLFAVSVDDFRAELEWCYWLYHALTPVFWVKRIATNWLQDRGLRPFQLKAKLRRLTHAR